MAQHIFETSEYELLMESKSLLKSALEREVKLRDQIERLNKEKIDTLTQNGKSVIITKKTVIEEHALLKRSESEISSLLKGGGNRFQSIGEFIYESCFNKVKTEKPTEETYIIKGMDDAVEEIKRLLKNDLDKDTKQKLENIQDLQAYSEHIGSRNMELIRESSSLKKELEIIKIHHDDIQQMLTCHAWQDITIFKIQDILKSISIWNFAKKAKEIVALIDTKPAMKLIHPKTN